MSKETEDSPKKPLWSWTLTTGALLAAGLPIIWFIMEPGFEPLIVSLPSIIAILIYLGTKNAEKQKRLDKSLAVVILIITIFLSVFLLKNNDINIEQQDSNSQEVQTQPGTDSSSFKLLSVALASPTPGNVMSRTYPVSNCSGSSVIELKMGDLANHNTEILVSSAIKIDGNVDVALPELTKAQLETEIARAYDKEIQQSQVQADTISLKAGPGIHITYVIDWHPSVYAASLQYLQADEIITVPYTLTISTPSLGSSSNIPCSP